MSFNAVDYLGALPKRVTRFGYTRPNSRGLQCSHLLVYFEIITPLQQFHPVKRLHQLETSRKDGHQRLVHSYIRQNTRAFRRKKYVFCRLKTRLGHGAEVKRADFFSDEFVFAGTVPTGLDRSPSKSHRLRIQAGHSMGEMGGK